jgi:exodeoxyribonuclease III
MTALNIVSWNVAGLRGILKKSPNVLATLAETTDADIICLQETKLSDASQIPTLGIESDYKAYWTYSTVKKGYSGVAMLVKKCHVPNIISVTYPDTLCNEGRLIVLTLRTVYSPNPLHVVGAYVPNSGMQLNRLNFRTEEWEPFILHLLQTLRRNEENCIYCGDLNVGHDSRLDMYKPNPTVAGMTIEEQTAMTDLLAAGFVDVYRQTHPTTKAFTYWSNMYDAYNKNKGYRLDYFICDADMYEKYAPGADIINDPLYRCSDHCPIILNITA